MKINIPNFPIYLPWFLFDIDNKQLITSQIIPSDIMDSKNIIISEQPIPGLNYSPVAVGGMGNRKLSFTLKILKRDSIFGNVKMLKQFENLREPVFSFGNLASKRIQFQPNPRVLYKWGTGSNPLVYYVTKCDFTHKQYYVNAFGEPKYSEVSLELTLDESNPVNKAEAVFRQLVSLIGGAESISDLVESVSTFKRTY